MCKHIDIDRWFSDTLDGLNQFSPPPPPPPAHNVCFLDDWFLSMLTYLTIGFVPGKRGCGTPVRMCNWHLFDFCFHSSGLPPFSACSRAQFDMFITMAQYFPSSYTIDCMYVYLYIQSVSNFSKFVVNHMFNITWSTLAWVGLNNVIGWIYTNVVLQYTCYSDPHAQASFVKSKSLCDGVFVWTNAWK